MNQRQKKNMQRAFKANRRDPPPKPLPIVHCEGCGYCCKKGPCSLYWHTKTAEDRGLAPWLAGEGCPHLVWDGEANRYWCGVILLAPGVQELKDVIAIGAGCSSSLFNSERRNIR